GRHLLRNGADRLAIDTSLAGRGSGHCWRDLFFRASHSAGFDHDPGAGERAVGPGSGGPELGPNGPRLRARGLGGAPVSFAGATAVAKRCFEVLDRADDVVDAPDAVEISETGGALGFDHVGFSYGPQQPVLHAISLSIAPNQIVAVVGGTGAGKSTLLSLVPRFYDPNAGSVTLDG